MTLDEELKKGIRRLEEQHQAFAARVLVFGPGDQFGKRKRINLIRRLRKQGFEACTSEQLSKRVPSFLNAFQQEDVHWRLFDIVLIFNFAIGVGQEVAAYAHDPEFREKAYVVYPAKYDPVGSGSFASQVLRQYPNKFPSTDDEWKSCFATRQGFEYAIAKRAIEFDKQR